MNAFTTIAVINRAPSVTNLHRDQPVMKVHGYDPDSKLPLLIKYRGTDAVSKAASIEPPTLLLVIGEIIRSSSRTGHRRPLLVIDAHEVQPVHLDVTDSLSMSLSWEVQARPFETPNLPFLDVDDEGNRRKWR